MALTAFCPTCQRTVYIEEENTPVCPVCSSPLLDTTANEEVAEKAEEEPTGKR
jgi:Zn finger protein HypA/HybF involved in hydrogenase expression